MRTRSRRAGFTLVEMLIVIMIIGVLASMVFVGIGRMAFTARGTVCKHNMRTLASAVIDYAGFYNGGRLPNFDFDPNSTFTQSGWGSTRVADEWVWALGYVDTLYYGYSNSTTILPPRSSHDILRCPSDTHYVVNAQRALTSYWAPAILSDRVLSRITRRSESPMFFEADPVNLSGGCGCRFHVQTAPQYAETYHDGGSNCAFVDGSVRQIWSKAERAISYNETEYYLYFLDGKRAKYPKFTRWENKGEWDDREKL